MINRHRLIRGVSELKTWYCKCLVFFLYSYAIVCKCKKPEPLTFCFFVMHIRERHTMSVWFEKVGLESML